MGRPKITEENGTNLVLSWKAARIPSYAKRSSITYIVESREPPAPNWVPLATDIVDTSYEIKDLKEEQDYMFRIRACNEAGQSEASLPATLYREIGKYYTFLVGLVGFYGISTIAGCLMPNLVITYILNI